MPSGDLPRKLAEAEHMLRELRNRNFGKHLREAEAEKREAQLCKDVPKLLHPVHANWLESTILSPQVRVAAVLISGYITVRASCGDNT